MEQFIDRIVSYIVFQCQGPENHYKIKSTARPCDSLGKNELEVMSLHVNF